MRRRVRLRMWSVTVSVRIDEIETDIDVQSDAPKDSERSGSRAPLWQALERLRHLTERHQKDETRTRSWDHDD